VSKFHLFWHPVAQESKLGRKFLGRPDIFGSITGHIRLDYQIYPPKPDISSPRPGMSAGEFQQQCLFTVLVISY
jgi:hypothetical protein